MRLKIFIISIFSVLIFISCTQSFQTNDLNIQPKDLIIRFKSKPLSIQDTTNSRKLYYNSDEYAKLIAWLGTNNRGWNKDLNSWAPAEIFITDGKDFRLLIYKNGIVLGYKTNNGKEVQLRKSISISNFDFLKNK